MPRILPHILLKAMAVAALTIAVAPRLSAQGDAMLTHYWAVPTYYNPAAAGDTDNIRLRGGVRAQWTGIDNAPRTFVGAADTPFKFLGKRWGAGVVVQQESYGLFRNLTANAQIGYKHKALKGEFTFALQAGFFNEQFKGSEVYIPDDDDYHQSTDNALPDRDVAGNAFDSASVSIMYTSGSKPASRCSMPTIPPLHSATKTALKARANRAHRGDGMAKNTVLRPIGRSILTPRAIFP